MSKPSIIFMGTPDFAVNALKALHESGLFEIALVVSQPDRPKGRGRKLEPTPVKAYAQAMGYRVEQPETVKSDEFIRLAEEIAPDFFVVVAFGQILNQRLLDVPRVCPVNIHGSLLPKYRGSAPIQRAVMNGDAVTGVTTMVMDRGMDTGDMLLTVETPIGPEDTAATLHDRLSELGGELIVKTLPGLLDGSVVPVPQDNEAATHAAMLSKAEGEIDWSAPARIIDCRLRGMTPWPGAFTFLDGKRLRIHKTQPLETAATDAPGTVVTGGSDLVVATGDGLLRIVELQGANGKRMPAEAFLRGNPIEPGARMGS
ncbi:methionyl-tRNA formyltransferase [Desulfoluna butyratoxydans]|uniref:Methionyl-tRNA formyltransferase n=1 Tax=Desulfoluna butyratoxydans TaxID=231438 RepID=A0A4U8YTL0_9BACT|nr:methionyl-tRNA formyltransferase [Desulfoluna butyratoxydans]VFQ47194.1 methionyl-trna formyltransferase [Desulfoluna butyratoxydans]